MALDDIRRELAEERERKAAEARREEEERLRRTRENALAVRPALRCLKELEPRFWSCSEAFAALCESKVDFSSRSQQGFWSKLLRRSCATEESPGLYITYEPGLAEPGQRHAIKLEARPEVLYFEAAYALMPVEAAGIQGSRYPYVVHRDMYPVPGFSTAKANKWLESQFERYFRDLTGWKEQFPELWNPQVPRSR